jgi:hypothetical protein
MRKTKNNKNRKRSTLAKIRRKLYSKRKGRGISASKISACLPTTRVDTAFNNRDRKSVV